MYHTAVEQLPETRQVFVYRVIDFEVLAFQVCAALPPVVEPSGDDMDIVLWTFADCQSTAQHAAGFINQGGGGWPQCIVEHGLV